MSRLTNPTPQYLDSAGDPLSKGLLYFYETQTSTLTDTYADSSQETKNSNPVVLYADGRQPNIFFTGTLKAILTNAALEQIWEKDPVTSGTGESLVTDWDALITYEASEIVRYNLIYYISLLNNNRDKIPGAEPLYWVTWPNGDIICDTVTADTFTGALVGDVTGNVTGNVTGDLTGTAGNSLSLGGDLAVLYAKLTDVWYPTRYSYYSATPSALTDGVDLTINTIDIGTLSIGDVIDVSVKGGSDSFTGYFTTTIEWGAGTASVEFNGLPALTSLESRVTVAGAASTQSTIGNGYTTVAGTFSVRVKIRANGGSINSSAKAINIIVWRKS